MVRSRRKARDLAGQRFGQLTALKRATNKRRPDKRGTITRWRCICDCGKQKVVVTQSLVSGSTRSCGCARGSVVKWDCKNNRLWKIWRGMISRAPVTDARVLAIYRGVGTHDPAWDDFSVFREWAEANGYSDTLTIDRTDYTVGYWPENCRWITNAAQQRNKSNNVVIMVAGEKMILVEAQERFGVTATTIRKRMKLGWPAEKAVLRMSGQKAAEIYADVSRR